MKTQNFIFLLLTLFTISTSAQKSFLKELNAKDIRYVSATNDGGYIVTSYYYLTKYDKDDNVVWTRKAADTVRTRFLQAIPTSSGDYAVLVSGGVQFSVNQTELIRMDDAGNIQWDKRFYNFDKTPARFVAEDWDGNFIVTGYYTATGDCCNGPFGYVAKISPQGDLLWKRTEIPGGSNETDILSVECIKTGKRYVISGSQNSNAYLSVLKEDGTVIGSSAYAATGFSYTGSSIKLVPDGLVFLPNGDNTQTDGIVMKFDFNGNIVWQKSIGGSDKDFLSVFDVSGDTLLVADKTVSFDAAAQKTDVYLVKMLTNGTVLWTKTIGGSTDEEPVAITRLQNGSYIIAAKDLNPLNARSYLIKIDADDNNCSAIIRTSTVTDATLRKKQSHVFQTSSFSSGTPLVSFQTVSAVPVSVFCADSLATSITASTITTNNNIQAKLQVPSIRIYPNPVRDNIQAELYTDKNTVANIHIINSNSQVVWRSIYSLTSGKNSWQINVAALPPGNYILLFTTGAIKQSIKFIKQ
jgi:hypothetical protein